MIHGVDEKIRENDKAIDKLLSLLDKAEKLAAARREQAREKGTAAMAITIAKKLGTRQAKTHGNYWNFECERFRIVFDDYGDNLSIAVGEETVFQLHLGSIVKYCPGEWEEALERYYKVARIKQQENKIADLQRQLQEKMNKWGIRPEELE